MVAHKAQFDSLLRLLNQDEERVDLASRSEIKYVLEGVDVGKLRSLLATNCRRVVHNSERSAVRSIYFDDANLSACRANLDGLGRRRKLRIRWYDSLLPGQDFFLEVKWRDNRVTGKHRMQIRSDKPLHEMSYRQIHRCLEETVPQHIVRDVVQYCDPIVIVQYDREHFVTHDGLRITLDYGLTYYDQTAASRVSLRFPQRLERLVVVEGKTPVGRESELRAWLHPLSLRAGKCSKYVHGCCRIGLIQPSEI